MTKAESDHSGVVFSVIIVNWNTRDLLLRCLDSVRSTCTGMSYEILLVDNGSYDGSVDAVRRHDPQVRCITNEINQGFGAANNQAFQIMKGAYALLLNTDAQLTPYAVANLLDFMKDRQDVGLVCGQLINTNGSLQNSVAAFPTMLSLLISESLLKRMFPRRYLNSKRLGTAPVAVDSCIGACIMIRKQILDELSGFDERYFFFFEETDLARSVWQSGWKVFYVPSAKIIHDQGQSAGHGARSRMLFYRARYQYLKKWHPGQFFVSVVLIGIRLLTNTLLNGLGVLITLGIERSIRNRFQRNFQVLRWHFSEPKVLRELDKPYSF